MEPPVPTNKDCFPIQGLFDFSLELRLLVWSFLDLATLLKTQEVSKEFSALSVDNFVWFAMCRKFFWKYELEAQTIEQISGKGISWKCYFAQRYLLAKRDSVIFSTTVTVDCIRPRYRHSCTLVSKPSDAVEQFLIVGGTGEAGVNTYGDVYMLEKKNFNTRLGVSWITTLLGGFLRKLSSSESQGGEATIWSSTVESKYRSSMVRVHPIACKGKSPNYMSTRHSSSFVNGCLWIWGGSHSSPPEKTNDMICFDVHARNWRVVTEYQGTPPSPRADHASAVVGNKIYIIGGSDSHVNPLNDVNIFDTVTLTWSQPQIKGTPPGPRSGHVCVCVGSKIYLYGGARWQANISKWTNKSVETFMLDTEQLTWTKLNTIGSPSVSTFTAAFPVMNFIWLVGGGRIDADYVSDCVHLFDTVTNVWKEIPLPPDVFQPRDCISATIAGSQVVLFGGFGGDPVNELQIIDMHWLEILKLCGLLKTEG